MSQDSFEALTPTITTCYKTLIFQESRSWHLSEASPLGFLCDAHTLFLHCPAIHCCSWSLRESRGTQEFQSMSLTAVPGKRVAQQSWSPLKLGQCQLKASRPSTLSGPKESSRVKGPSLPEVTQPHTAMSHYQKRKGRSPLLNSSVSSTELITSIFFMVFNLTWII